MRRVLAAAAISAAALGASPAYGATLHERTVQRFGASAVQRYERLHAKWTKVSGHKVVGRNIARYGQPGRKPGSKRVATRAEWSRTLTVFSRWEHPPVVHTPVATVRHTSYRPRTYTAPTHTAPSQAPTTTSTQSSSGSYSGGGGLPPESVAQAESGGSYTAVNPSSGAYGKYQLMPLHYGAGGVCAGMGKSPSEQDTCASRVLATQGPSAWSQTWGR